MSREAYTHLVKVVFVGPSGAGKSQLMNAISDKPEPFSANHVSTIGVDFATAIVKEQGEVIKLQLWDTAGQERYRSITISYYRGAKIACLMWDATNSYEVDHLGSWVREGQSQMNNDSHLIFVRCKSDLDSTLEADVLEARIKKVQGIAFDCGIQEPIMVSTSAATKEGISELKTAIAKDVLNMLKENAAAPVQIVRAAPKPSEPFFLTERLEKIKHTRNPRTTELKMYFDKAKPTTKEIEWLLLHLDSVEKECSTATNIREYLKRFKIDIDHRLRPTQGPVVELLKLLDEEERAKPPKVVTLLTFASYSDLYVAERDVERKFILDVAKNIYLNQDPFQGLDKSKAPKAVLDIIAKHSPAPIP